MPSPRLMLPLLLAWALAAPAWAQQAPSPVFPQTTVAYLDADERPLPGPDSAAYRVETLRPDSVRAVVRRYYATGALAEYAPYLDLARGLLHGTRTTWYADGQLHTKEEYVGGRRQGELLAYYPDGTLKRRDRYAHGQNVPGACYGPDGRPVPYFPYEQPPLYPGGDLLLYHDVTRLVRPTAAEMRRFGAFGSGLPALEAGTYRRWPVGTIDVAFTVTARGEVADPYVARSTAPWLNEKVLAAVRGLSKRFWPGQRDGQTVCATYHVPVLFTSTSRPALVGKRGPRGRNFRPAGPPAARRCRGRRAIPAVG